MPEMPPARRPPQQAGGCLIAAGLIFGPLVGMLFGQTSIGLIAGLVIGVVAAIVMAVRDGR
jgi:F0F1-type ATP synthase assembly protein I